MILEQQTDNIVLEEGETEKVYTTEIDMESIHFLKQMLSKFYADPIGSLIRETCSNALDSHRELGTDEPIIVSFLPNAQGNYEFSVEDFGIGINEETVDKILKKYGKSTKRNSNTQLGMFGLGWKSPISYTSSFYFTGRKDGVETKAMMYESEDDIMIDIMYTKETTEKNGVKVTVPVKWNDKHTFYEKIKEQLAYFENVYFDCGDYIKNDFKITRHDDFQFSPLCKNTYMHICLDNVYYPLDFQKIGVPHIEFPIGLRFTLSDGIFPTPNRESVKYSKECIEIIKKKIEKVSNFFVEKYNETIQDTDNIFNIIKYYNSSDYYLNNYLPVPLNVSLLKDFTTVKWVKPNMKGVKLLNLQRVHQESQNLLWEYHRTFRFQNGKFKHLNQSYDYNIGNISYIDEKQYLVYTKEIKKQDKDYFRDTHSGQYYFIKKYRTMPLGKLTNAAAKAHDNYITILQLYDYPKSQWRDLIKEWQFITNSIISKFEDFDKVVVPKQWIEDKKKKVLTGFVSKQRRKKLDGEVTGKVARFPNRWVTGKNCVLEAVTIQMKDAHTNKKVTIVCSTDESEDVNKYFKSMDSSKVRFVIFSEKELKRLKDVDLHNWITMEEFKKGKHKIFRRAVTAYLINELAETQKHAFHRRDLIKDISTVLYDEMVKLDEYKDDHYRSAEPELYKSMVELAEEAKLFDPKIYDTYKEVKFVLEKLPFINNLLKLLPSFSDAGQKEALSDNIKDLCKYHKFRINWENYKLPLNEEVKIEETI